MAAAPVHTLVVTNIHHTHQHQCWPNEDALPASVVNNRQENAEGFQWSCAYVSVVHSFVCVAAFPYIQEKSPIDTQVPNHALFANQP